MTAVDKSQQPVSFDEERLILVDSHDNIVGYDTKLNAHRGAGTLHRAFSIFLFDGPGRVMLHQRSESKPLWPGFWTNSCCSHPRCGESYQDATARRLREELGISSTLTRLYQFEYHARYNSHGSEHELCSVFAGNLPTGETVSVNDYEIMAWDWFDVAEVDALVAQDPARFTPWFLLEWSRLRGPCNSMLHDALGAPPVPLRAAAV